MCFDIYIQVHVSFGSRLNCSAYAHFFPGLIGRMVISFDRHATHTLAHTTRTYTHIHMIHMILYVRYGTRYVYTVTQAPPKSFFPCYLTHTHGARSRHGTMAQSKNRSRKLSSFIGVRACVVIVIRGGSTGDENDERKETEGSASMVRKEGSFVRNYRFALAPAARLPQPRTCSIVIEDVSRDVKKA